VLCLSSADIEALADMPAAIDAVERAFIDLSAGRATAPVRTPIASERPSGVTLFMPGAVPALGALGAKIVSVRPENPTLGRALIQAVVVLVDPVDGAPVALLEGRALTALRTGAASGVATRHLARPEASVLTCFGAGVQAEQQIRAVRAVRPIRRVVLCTPTRARADALARRLAGGGDGLAVAVEPDPALAAGQADIICTATTARVPVFPATAARAGVHINGVGSYTLAMAEVPAAVVGRAVVVVDHAPGARAEAGDLAQAVAAGLADDSVYEREVGAVAAGLAAGRGAPEQITFFKSVGNAVQDMAVARLLVGEATRRGLGQRVAL
jgi:ornithine cyclodeaminase/alanine dehydrogenase-like protein (mu-crystallin family)